MTDDVTAVPLTEDTETPRDDSTTDATTESVSDRAPAPQYGVGPFSIREVALAGVWLVAFLVSFFSLSTLRFDSVWTSGLLWILSIGLPSVAVFLIVLRRLSPDGIRRVGSLGIDQFASVAFSVAAILWLQLVWETVAFVVADGPWVRSWVMWVELVLMLAGVVLTVFAPILPVIGDDFRDRREVPAHRNARPIRAVAARPPRPKPEPRPVRQREPEPQPTPTAANPYEAGSYDGGASPTTAYDPNQFAAPSSGVAAYPASGGYDTDGYDVDQTVASARSSADDSGWAPDSRAADRVTEISPEPERAPVAAQQAGRPQPFWALAPTERDVYDAQGAPLFRIGPTAWALVIEDRASVYIVRHEDGRIGYLHDVSGVTRG